MVIVWSIIFVLMFVVVILYLTTYSRNEKFISSSKPNLKNFSVVIVGTCKNIEKEIKNSISKFEMIGNLFKSYNIIVYENDSQDRTVNILKNMAANNKNIKVISEKNVPGRRTNRLSHGRNILLNEAKKIQPDYLVVADMDNINNKLTEKNFIKSFKYKDWEFMGANQTDNYYDLWALRTYDDWMPSDCKPGHPRTLCKKHKNIDNKNKLIKVKSAFGGLGIYDMRFILKNANNCMYYGGELNKSEVCEHVAFNECLVKNGARLFINPGMINTACRKGEHICSGLG